MVQHFQIHRIIRKRSFSFLFSQSDNLNEVTKEPNKTELIHEKYRGFGFNVDNLEPGLKYIVTVIPGQGEEDGISAMAASVEIESQTE